MVAYISVEKSFDIRTLEIIMNGTKEEISKLIERNIERFYSAHLVQYAEDLPTLNKLKKNYCHQLKEKISATETKLASTNNGKQFTSSQASDIFIRTIHAVENELRNLSVDIFPSQELQENISGTFAYQKDEALMHFSMFIDQYISDLKSETNKYLKKYVQTMIQHGYIFSSGDSDDNYSLLIFLSFYEAYAKRIIGLSLLDYAKENRGLLRSELKSSEDADRQLAKDILHYADSVKVPDAKSCYFIELQKWFKGEIEEFIERFMIITVDETYIIPYQKKTLIDKKKLRSGKCTDIIEPPFVIPSPSIIDSFFLLSDSHYTIM